MHTSTYTGEGSMGTGFGGWGFVVFFLFILWIFFDRNKEDYCNQDMRADSLRSTAEIEYRNLEEQRNAKEAIMTQASAIRNEQLAAELFDLKLNGQTTTILNNQTINAKDGEIDRLKLALVEQERYCALNSKIDSLACSIPQRPPYYAQGFVTTGQPIPVPVNACYGV